MYGGELLSQGSVGGSEGGVCGLGSEDLGCEGGAGGLGGAQVLTQTVDLIITGLIRRAGGSSSRDYRSWSDALTVSETSV